MEWISQQAFGLQQTDADDDNDDDDDDDDVDDDVNFYIQWRSMDYWHRSGL